MICMMPLVHWKVDVYIGCLVLLDTMIAIPMGTHYTTFMTDLFLHIYEPDFSSLIEIEMYLKAINSALCCIDYVLSLQETLK